MLSRPRTPVPTRNWRTVSFGSTERRSCSSFAIFIWKPCLTLPAPGATLFASRLSRVDFPTPFVPTTANRSPLTTRMLKSRTIQRFPYRFDKSLASITSLLVFAEPENFIAARTVRFVSLFRLSRSSFRSRRRRWFRFLRPVTPWICHRISLRWTLSSFLSCAVCSS